MALVAPTTTKTLVDRIDAYNVSGKMRRTVSSCRYGNKDEPELTPSPPLKDAAASELSELLIKKLIQCKKVFDFSDPFINVKSKEVKRAALNELISYYDGQKKAIPEEAYPHVVEMVKKNLFRSLPPPPPSSFDPEEDEPTLELSWPHLGLVYEFFLIFLESRFFHAGAAKKCISGTFILNILRLFDSEDPRERDFLKTVLHRIYGKFIGLRAFIRKEINNVFLTFIYETGAFNGVGELLEILGSIINGFAVPLKEEHKSFLKRVLMPLHKPQLLSLYHTQLCYCVSQFVSKDPSLLSPVFTSLFHYWPRTCTKKEVLFLGEADELLESVEYIYFKEIAEPLCRQLAKSFQSGSFQVTERALTFWSDEHFTHMTSLSSNEIFPIVIPALMRVVESHWNPQTRLLANAILEILSKCDDKKFIEVKEAAEESAKREKKLHEEREAKWRRLEEMAEKSEKEEDVVQKKTEKEEEEVETPVETTTTD